MFSSYFEPGQQGMLALGFGLALTSVVLHVRRRTRWALMVLTLSAFVLRLFAAWLDSFLNDWDEVYHAVVAKNLIAHPFTPMLYQETALPITTLWSEQHIWLHKPPFFLWQMALSLKIFGVHPWAVRLPSVFWLTALVPVVWRMGCLLRNSATGFVAAFLVAFSFLLQELTAGAINTDHNDAVFIAMVACSWWAWLECMRSPSWKWAAAVGALSACAVLTKWYLGGCVFLPWGLWGLSGRFQWPRLKWMLLAIGIMALPVCAWLIHINHWFPREAAYEWMFKALHFSEPMDGHSGTWTFHFDVTGVLLPPLTWWLLLPAFAWLVWRTQQTVHRLFLISLLVGVHVFFILAQTKMVCYTMMLFPLYAIAVAHTAASLVDLLPWAHVRPAIIALTTFGMGWAGLSLEWTQARHTLQESPLGDRRWRLQHLEAARQLNTLYDIVTRAEKPVVFHVPRNYHLRFMFAHDVEAWSKPPGADDVRRLVAKGYTVFVLQDGTDAATFPPGIVLVPDSVVSIPRDVRM